MAARRVALPLLALAAGLCLATLASAEGAGSLTAQTWEESKTDGRAHFVKFYAPWCGHCQKMAPDWVALEEYFANDDRVSIDNVDCTQHKDLCQNNGVTGYPTLKSFYAGGELENYRGPRELSAFKEFAVKAISVADKLKQAHK